MLRLGTWDYPLLIIATPHGFKDWSGPRPEWRYRLIEGHLRIRFPHAMQAKKLGNLNHEVLVLPLGSTADPAS